MNLQGLTERLARTAYGLQPNCVLNEREAHAICDALAVLLSDEYWTTHKLMAIALKDAHAEFLDAREAARNAADE